VATLDAVRQLPESEPLARACSQALAAAAAPTATEVVLGAGALGDRDPDDAAVGVVELVAAGIGVSKEIAFSPPAAARPGESRQSLQAAAGIWMRGEAARLAATLGDYAVDALAQAQTRIATGQAHAFEDLYDPARPPVRCLLVAALRGGALFELAVRLGAGDRGSGFPARLSSIATDLGVAAEIVEQVERIRDPGLAAADLRCGVYDLPVSNALESDPGLAARMTAGLDPARVGDLVAALLDTRGVALALAMALHRAEGARLELDEEHGGDELAAIAQRIADRCEQAGVADAG
jgi:hypothetical protein